MRTAKRQKSQVRRMPCKSRIEGEKKSDREREREKKYREREREKNTERERERELEEKEGNCLGREHSFTSEQILRNKKEGDRREM